MALVNESTKFSNRLCTLVAAGDLDEVKKYLKENPNKALTTEKDGRTALHVAVSLANDEAVKLLLEAGANPNKYLPSSSEDDLHAGWTPVHIAASLNNTAALTSLLDAGGEVDTEASDRATPLAIAATRGSLDAVTLLLERGAKPSGSKKCPALVAAIGNGHVEVALALLSAGADPARCSMDLFREVSENNGAAVLALEAIGEHAPSVMQQIAKLEVSQSTLLQWAASIGAVKLVSALVKAGAEVNFDQGWSSLARAAANGHIDTMKYLLSAGADIDRAMKSGESPVSCAASSGQVASIVFLLSQGAKVDLPNKFGTTALIMAASEGHPKAVAILAKNGADVNHQAEGGMAAVHFAAKRNHADVLRVLSQLDADINLVNEQGATALHYAANEKHRESCSVLMSLGADPNFKDVKDGRSALQWANDADIKDLLANFKLVECHNASCQKVEKIYKQFACCSRCKSAAYCGGACQLADWKAGHQQECKTLQAAAAAAAASSSTGSKKAPQTKGRNARGGRKGKGKKR